MKTLKLYILLLITTTLASCTTKQPQLPEAWSVCMDSTRTTDCEFDSIIKIYRDTLNMKLEQTIGYCDSAMDVYRPETPLTRLFADALLHQMRKYAAQEKLPKPEFSLHNIGGIRTTMNPGEVKIHDMYEISPFDNVPVILQMRGNDLCKIFEHVAERGGEALSGATLTISADSVLMDVKIGGLPIDTSRIYTFATVDYLANGGDKFNFTKTLKRYTANNFMREVFTDYISTEYTAKGRHLTPPNDIRITVDSKKLRK